MCQAGEIVLSGLTAPAAVTDLHIYLASPGAGPGTETRGRFQTFTRPENEGAALYRPGETNLHVRGVRGMYLVTNIHFISIIAGR